MPYLINTSNDSKGTCCLVAARWLRLQSERSYTIFVLSHSGFDSHSVPFTIRLLTTSDNPPIDYITALWLPRCMPKGYRINPFSISSLTQVGLTGSKLYCDPGMVPLQALSFHIVGIVVKTFFCIAEFDRLWSCLSSSFSGSTYLHEGLTDWMLVRITTERRVRVWNIVCIGFVWWCILVDIYIHISLYVSFS